MYLNITYCSLSMNKEEFLKLTESFDHIIFDYGGIFINIDYEQTTKALNILSPQDATSLYSKKIQATFFDEFETGKLSSKEFITCLKESLKINASNDEITKAWNAMLLGIPKERFEFIKELREQKKIYLLSNINQIHEDFLNVYIQSRPELTNFYSSFDEVYFSHHIGLRKPNIEAFEFVLNKHAMPPEKTLFIDDSPQHIEGAKKAGLNTYYLSPANTFIIS